MSLKNRSVPLITFICGTLILLFVFGLDWLDADSIEGVVIAALGGCLIGYSFYGLKLSVKVRSSHSEVEAIKKRLIWFVIGLLGSCTTIYLLIVFFKMM